MSTVEPYASPNAITYEGRDFTEDEARRLTADIKAWAGTLWVRLRDAHDGKAHKALGYATWTDYLAGEFDISKSQGYRLLRHSRDVEALADAAGLSDLSPMGDISERDTRAIDTHAAAADVAAALAAEPDASTERRVEIVEKIVEKHRRTVDAGTGEILIEGPSSDAPVPPGAVEPDDDAAPNVEGSATPGEGAAPEGSDGSPTADPSDDRKPAPPSPALQRAKLAEQASKAAHAVRSKLLPLDPADIAAVCPADEWDAFQSLAVDLRRWCDQVDAAFSPNLRSVQ